MGNIFWPTEDSANNKTNNKNSLNASRQSLAVSDNNLSGNKNDILHNLLMIIIIFIVFVLPILMVVFDFGPSEKIETYEDYKNAKQPDYFWEY